MLNSTLAGFGNRFVAQIIDSLIVGFLMSVTIIPIFGISIFTGGGFSGLEPDEATGLIVAATLVPVFIIGFVGPIIYEIVMLNSSKQATLGKIIMKIRVEDETGQKLTLGAVIGRTLIKYLSFQFCFLLWLWPLFNDKEQALHDIVVKDFVVRG
ncbi:RDD family protein [Dyadobacter psychrotolerans]|uniref:RDD family protein n=1 Tax=Dyadobacter psychrotolerans TaxID=2541721 RepID=A0A4R5DR38_9BACT|nr:RDD family protein [Dyadobacter psychrotolerans]TDE16769.1 RDD family protein [Dyadobacter psychrotolerans]